MVDPISNCSPLAHYLLAVACLGAAGVEVLTFQLGPLDGWSRSSGRTAVTLHRVDSPPDKSYDENNVLVQ